jgi:short-chain Z-isoprenyl diphosphate synthase
VRNLIYRLYERSLERGLVASDLPKHVAVMLDGNRRWAERRPGAKAAHGHAAGANKIFEFLGWCDEIGINLVTLYMLSTDNLVKRESKELADLLKIIGSVATEMAKRKRWKIRIVGDRSSLPGELLAELEAAEKATAKLNKPEVNLAVGYGGRKEIADAMRSILKKHSGEGTTIEQLADLLTPELITDHLYTGGQADPDLIIRT